MAFVVLVLSILLSTLRCLSLYTIKCGICGLRYVKKRVHKQCIEITREEKNRYQILLKFFLIGHVAEDILYYYIVIISLL